MENLIIIMKGLEVLQERHFMGILFEIQACVHGPKSYRKVSNIRRTKSQNLNASRLILQLSLPNPLKPGVKLRMKM